MEIERTMKALRAQHRIVLDEWKRFHRAKTAIEEESKALQEEYSLLAQGQLMLPVPRRTSG